MLIRTAPSLRAADVTDPALYASRRTVLAGMGLGAAALLGGAGAARAGDLSYKPGAPIPQEPATSRDAITGYNNYYEFGTGLYGQALPNQNGAPLRLVVPWKYGFKGIKAIVRISLLKEKPKTTWNLLASSEYGFYANVNPMVDHPRWSQAHEQRIGEHGRRDTLPFNGYGEQVASLYSGMDLREEF